MPASITSPPASAEGLLPAGRECAGLGVVGAAHVLTVGVLAVGLQPPEPVTPPSAVGVLVSAPPPLVEPPKPLPIEAQPKPQPRPQPHPVTQPKPAPMKPAVAPPSERSVSAPPPESQPVPDPAQPVAAPAPAPQQPP